MTYQHKQLGFVTISISIILFLFLLDLMVMSIVFWSDTMPGWATPVIIVGLALAVLFGALMSSMTVRVDKGQLIWHFAFGFWKKTINLAEISLAQQVHNKWWYGWGVKRIRGGWLYNVSGMQAVEVKLENGRLFRLGSDEPEELVAAIERAKAAI